MLYNSMSRPYVSICSKIFKVQKLGRTIHVGVLHSCLKYRQCYLSETQVAPNLGDPGADSGGKGKSKRAEKYGTKKSKGRREEPLRTMSYQTNSNRSPPFWLLIGQKSTKVFWYQSAARTAVTVGNWSGQNQPSTLLYITWVDPNSYYQTFELGPRLFQIVPDSSLSKDALQVHGHK